MTTFTLASGLDALRAQHTDLLAKAEAKAGEIKDTMTADEIAKVETSHTEIVANAKKVADAITAEEKKADQPKAKGWVLDFFMAAAKTDIDKADLAKIASESKTHEEAKDRLIDMMASGDVNKPNKAGHVAVLRDENDTLRAGLEAAISLRANPNAIQAKDAESKALVEQAREWRGMTLLEMGRTYAEAVSGKKIRGKSKMELATTLLGLDGFTMAGGSLSTSDFPNVLANVISKRLRDAYQVAPQNWKRLGRQSNAPDFKTRSVVQLSNLPNLKQVVEGGSYQYAGLSDAGESYALGTYGRIVAVTRQTLINDDLGAFDRIPMLLGRAAAETEASTFWAIITGNPDMSDGNPLFDSSHGNVAGSGAAITISTLNDARVAMRTQKGLAAKAADEEPLNIIPAYLVVSPDKETEAQQFLATTLYPATNSNVNPFAGSMIQITEARLSGNAWYVFADPQTALVDTIEYAYLEGEAGIYTEQRLGFEVDGIEVKARLDFAAKAIDWRGMYKNGGN